MKAIVQDVYGGADVLQLRDIDRPVPKDGEVLIKVRAAGVDPSVWHLMMGKPYAMRLAFGIRKPRQRVRGWDVAGVVEQVGAKVTRFKVGDEVFGSAPGSFAEYVCGKPARLALKPGNLTFEEAGALCVSAITAYQILDRTAPRPGQKILVIGASGGVGTFAVQIARMHGLQIAGVCGPGKEDLLRSLGVNQVVDYSREDVTEGSTRYDIIVDVAGNRPLKQLSRILAPDGIVVMAGGEEGGAVLGGMERGLGALARRPFTRQRFRTHFASTRQGDLMAVRDLAEKGELKPIIDTAYPLAEAADAIRHLENGHPRGKLVVTI